MHELYPTTRNVIIGPGHEADRAIAYYTHHAGEKNVTVIVAQDFDLFLAPMLPSVATIPGQAIDKPKLFVDSQRKRARGYDYDHVWDILSSDSPQNINLQQETQPTPVTNTRTNARSRKVSPPSTPPSNPVPLSNHASSSSSPGSTLAPAAANRRPGTGHLKVKSKLVWFLLEYVIRSHPQVANLCVDSEKLMCSLGCLFYSRRQPVA